MEKLSPELKSELIISSYESLLKSALPILYKLFSDETTRKLPLLVEEISIPPNEFIFHKNCEKDKAIYIVTKGVVELSIRFGKNNIILGRIG